MASRLCYLLLIVIFLSIPLFAGELHIWVDKKGVTHIGDRPPEMPAKIIGKEISKRDSPEEIRRYEVRQKNLERQRALEEERNRLRQESYRISEEQARSRDNYNRQQEGVRQKRSADRAEDLAFEKERLRAVENRNYDEARKISYKAQRRRIERREQE
jgi:hypothetical protein